MGLVGSISSLYDNVFADCKQYKKINFVTGLFAVLLIIMGVIAFLILGEVIVPNTKANDVISLFALLYFCVLMVKNKTSVTKGGLLAYTDKR